MVYSVYTTVYGTGKNCIMINFTSRFDTIYRNVPKTTNDPQDIPTWMIPSLLAKIQGPPTLMPAVY